MNIDEKAGIILFKGYMVIWWFDEFRKWEKVFPYNCTEYLVIPPGEATGIWLPDVALVKDENLYGFTRSDEILIRMYRDGQMSITPSGVFQSQCKFDLTFFPFDSQTCEIRIEGWRYRASQQAFVKYGAGFELRGFQEPEQWAIVDMKFEIYNTSIYLTAFPAVSCFLTLERKSSYYVMNIIIPSFILSLVEILTFTLPESSEGRLELSFACLLAFAVYQNAMSNDLPRSSDNTPLLSIYITSVMGYIFLAIIFHGIVIQLARKGKEKQKNPKWLRFIYRKSTKYKTSSNSEPLSQPLWQQFAASFDRVAVCIYILLVLGTPISLCLTQFL